MRCPRLALTVPRRGAAAVEFAILLPILAFLFVIAVDYGRIFYYSVTLQNAARSGALYGCTDSTHAADQTGIQTAALKDATNLSPTPTVASTTGNDADGNPTVTVTVTWTFQTVVNYPGVSRTVALNRTASMRVLP